MLKEMKAENLKIEEADTERYINFAKKFNIKFKFLKIVLIIILAIVIILILRKAIIIKDLLSKAEQYTNIDNYYSKYYQYNSDQVTIIESYYKDNKYLRFQKNINKDTGETTETIREYYNGKTSNCYIDLQDKKIAYININSGMVFPVESKAYYIRFNNKLELIRNCIFSSIKSVNCNGKKCYRFTDLCSIQTYPFEEEIYAYIDKNTGLPIRCSGEVTYNNPETFNTIIDYYYEFYTVTDNIFVEPNIDEYIIQN